jgi:hypothetical protein
MPDKRDRRIQRTNPHFKRIERVAYLLDGSITIPGTQLKIGLDPLIGLLPGIGDVVGGWASLYIIYLAARAGLPGAALLRMIANVLVDVTLGAFPVLGDLFDFGWKVNLRNVAIIERYLERQSDFKPRSRRELTTSVVVLIGGCALGLAAALILVAWGVARLISG